MTRFEYCLTEEDLLKFQLYYASVSPAFRRQRVKQRYVVPAIYIFIALLFLNRGRDVTAIAFSVLAVVWFLVLPAWMRWHYRRHFRKHLAETSEGFTREPIVLQTTADGIYSASFLGESTFRYEAVGDIVDHEGYTYVFIGKGNAIILPHDRIEDEVREAFVKEIERNRPVEVE